MHIGTPPPVESSIASKIFNFPLCLHLLSFVPTTRPLSPLADVDVLEVLHHRLFTLGLLNRTKAYPLLDRS
ncbi:hypothetical protein DY000_02040577 [Brassica cretica]|uniref:Uncharacterized protein n=1 Tax=Brassica cretica TaxID=69181 RepID=A0ABQ7BJ45_BRACR|nr:hypothetical protein DY000_02040577 [Brassica cretica]